MLEKHPDLAMTDEYGLFLKLFDQIIAYINDKTSLYGQRDKIYQQFFFICKECVQFIGLLILSAINLRTSERDYWRKSPYLKGKIFVETMGRNHFQTIKSCLHAEDNQNLGVIKMVKVTPLYDLLI